MTLFSKKSGRFVLSMLWKYISQWPNLVLLYPGNPSIHAPAASSYLFIVPSQKPFPRLLLVCARDAIIASISSSSRDVCSPLESQVQAPSPFLDPFPSMLPGYPTAFNMLQFITPCSCCDTRTPIHRSHATTACQLAGLRFLNS